MLANNGKRWETNNIFFEACVKYYWCVPHEIDGGLNRVKCIQHGKLHVEKVPVLPVNSIVLLDTATSHKKVVPIAYFWATSLAS